MKQMLFALRRYLSWIFGFGPKQPFLDTVPALAGAGEPVSKEAAEPPTTLDAELQGWIETAAKFNVKTDILVIPKDNDRFIEKATASMVLTEAINEAYAQSRLVPIADFYDVSVVRNGSVVIQ
jgi:hypothetical protein